MPYGRRTYKRRAYPKSRYSSRKKASRYAKRARYNGPGRYRKAMPLRTKWLNPDTQSKLVKFTYTDTGFSRTLNVGNSYVSYYVFRGNSPYDPDYTGIGVQSYSFDQYVGAALYAGFNCYSSSIRIWFRPEEAYASMRRLHVSIFPFRSVNPVLTDVSDMRMIPKHKETTYDGATETTKGCKLKHYSGTKFIYNDATANDASFEGNYAGNPSVGWYWIVCFHTDVFDDEEVDIYFDVKIKYYTKLVRSGVPNES